MWFSVIGSALGLFGDIEGKKKAEQDYYLQQTTDQQGKVAGLVQNKSDVALVVILLLIVGIAIFFAVKK